MITEPRGQERLFSRQSWINSTTQYVTRVAEEPQGYAVTWTTLKRPALSGVPSGLETYVISNYYP
jgi:hypothetical protein